MICTLIYHIHDLLPYINWLYFFHAWGMPPRFAKIAEVHDCPACRKSWVEGHDSSGKAQAVEAERLHSDAVALLRQLDAQHVIRARFGLFGAWSEGDDIVVSVPVSDVMSETKQGGERTARLVRLPFLRQQRVAKPGQPYLCLSDFIVPKVMALPPEEIHFPVTADSPRGRILGVFASAVEPEMEHLFGKDDYQRMLVQTLCDRLAEAAAEKMHEEVRQQYWGYAPDEHYAPAELFVEKYEGRRPAVGYPSIPDQSINFLLDELIGMEHIGIHLTESGMMSPHAAVSGLLFDHPAARHFSVGPIGEDQLTDYAHRRGCPREEAARFLEANLIR